MEERERVRGNFSRVFRFLGRQEKGKEEAARFSDFFSLGVLKMGMET